MKPGVSVTVFLLALLWAACGDRDRKGNPLDTPTSGSIKIAVDESLLPLLDAEVDTFEGIYRNASIDVTYTSEQDAVDLLLKDSVRLIVITRPLVEEEVQAFAKQVIKPHDVTVAKDGIALILHRDNPDSLFTIDQLKRILSGDISRWNQIRANAKADPVEVVFDQPNSALVRYLRDSLAVTGELPKNFFAMKSNPAVVDHVAAKPNAIGLIGVSWISDRDDSTSHSFLGTIRVASIKHDSDFYQPHQAYIAQRHYPLVREVIVISREMRAGLGSGFLAFFAGDKGQRIVLKAGLVPVTMPIRIVQVNHQPFK